MPKAINPITVDEKQDFRKLKGVEKVALRVGLFYSKFNTHQRHRYQNIVNVITKAFGLSRAENPLETIIIRQIALNLILSDKNALKLLEMEEPEHVDDIKGVLWRTQKEIRSAVSLLHSISQIKRKKSSVDIFGELRDDLRKKEGLKESEQKEYHPDGHDRRFHKDGVTRTEET